MPNQNYQDHVFQAKDFSQESLAGKTFSQCTFENCTFIESSFERASFWGCTFKNCNLSLVNLRGCRMQDVVFKESKLVGLNFSVCDVALFFSITIKQSYAQHCNFSELVMNKTIFDGSKMHKSSFVRTKLKEASFKEVDLKGSTFHESDLSEANFEGAQHYTIDPRTNILKNAQFSFPECIGLLRAMDINIIS